MPRIASYRLVLAIGLGLGLGLGLELGRTCKRKYIFSIILLLFTSIYYFSLLRWEVGGGRRIGINVKQKIIIIIRPIPLNFPKK